jgi:hypothetical protein
MLPLDNLLHEFAALLVIAAAIGGLAVRPSHSTPP